MHHTSCTAREVRHALERILSTPAFRSTPSLSRLLRFIVEQALQGGASELSERVIAREVFAAPAEFDPCVDVAVMLHARRLRKRLKQYRETQGRRDPVWITIPEQSFSPTFEGRRAPGGQP